MTRIWHKDHFCIWRLLDFLDSNETRERNAHASLRACATDASIGFRRYFYLPTIDLGRRDFESATGILSRGHRNENDEIRYRLRSRYASREEAISRRCRRAI